MHKLEEVAKQYGGTHAIDACGWTVSRVDLIKRTAFVCNGNWQLHWDDTDLYCKRHGFLEWLYERPAGFEIRELEHESVG